MMDTTPSVDPATATEAAAQTGADAKLRDPRLATSKQRKHADAYLRAENAKYGHCLREIPPDDWPTTATIRAAGGSGTKPLAVYRSKNFLVQIFDEPKYGSVRLSVCRTRLTRDGLWEDGITWDELMQIKREVGMADRCAVEVYPADANIVNVANMRHLWILREGMVFGWSRSR
jgi:hypothetical protein